MIERGLDDSGSSTTSSTTAAKKSSSGDSSVRGGGAGAAASSWATRSKLPFHKLPFEVQQYHLAQRLNSTSSSSRRPRSAAAAAAAPPAEEVDESAVVERAWFPLMPPAMAGEARQSSQPLALSQHRRVTDGTGEGFVDPCETAADCAAVIAPGEESGQQGSERRWASMEG